MCKSLREGFLLENEEDGPPNTVKNDPSVPR